MSACNAPHPTLTDVRCDRTRGHRGDHQASGTRGAALGGEQWPRGARGGARNLETSSIVLSALAAGASYEAAGAAAGVTKQRAAAIAAAAGGRPETTDSALLARLRELAAAAGEDPGDYIEDAARCRAACEAIAERCATLPSSASLEDLLVFRGFAERLAVGHNPPELAAQVRAVVDAAGSSDDRTK